MVYYIRFLKTPRFEVQKKQVSISALICITTDLGDDFLAEHVDLVATWAHGFSPEILSSTELKWHAGARQLLVQMPVQLKPRQVADAPHAAILDVRPQSSPPFLNSFGEQSIPLVISGSSDYFHWPSKGPADKFIKRVFQCQIPGEPSPTFLNIWEETGNSIARHIW